MKMLIKILKWTGIILVSLILLIFIFVQATWNKKFDAPMPAIEASQDSSVIARGKYLAYGPAHCGTCHVTMNKMVDVEKGEIIPLSGGWEINIPPGSFRAPNITPDAETGIGSWTDGEIARALRYSVNKDNGCVFPFMPFQELSDEDLTAIVSFLRSQPAVKNKVPKTELTFLGKTMMSFGLIKPEQPKITPPKSVKRDTTPEYGAYIAHRVANCVGCHTDRDLKTGKFIGEPFAGGMYFPPEPWSKGKSFVSPNLTPDTETGVIANWNEPAFLSRFKVGYDHASPMPWGSFSRIDELELKAVYRYLKTLKPVKKKIAKTILEPGEQPAVNQK